MCILLIGNGLSDFGVDMMFCWRFKRRQVQGATADLRG